MLLNVRVRYIYIYILLLYSSIADYYIVVLLRFRVRSRDHTVQYVLYAKWRDVSRASVHYVRICGS